MDSCEHNDEPSCSIKSRDFLISKATNSNKTNPAPWIVYGKHIQS